MTLRSLDASLHAPGLSEADRAVLTHDWAFAAPGPGRDIQVSRGPLPPEPAGLAQPVALPERTLPVIVRGHDLWIAGQLHVNVHAGLITCARETTDRDVWVLALTELHRAAGWLPLHAALIGAADEARGVLVTGPSGAGKSTACLRLRAHGLRVLAEDRVWWTPGGPVTGMDRTLRAHRDSVDRFAPHLTAALPELPRDVHGKFMLPLSPGGAAALQAVLMLGSGETPSGPRRVQLAWEMTGVPLTALGRQATATGIQALLRQSAWQAVRRDQVPARVMALLAERPGIETAPGTSAG
ncbi:hypothetical protein LAJ19_02905 [Deinococcus taeanensis]|uniref:hypothetical protein n=1 Tax=Deinococcus taeanensis TaxID=2737050 RepID=UPI001CDC4898|nr:hypothetical protein [Deinococcus taeanensis]UBV43188.1 hypothetical protein LAJ19_02905 [Deinococcus taeanensis]